MNHPSKLTKTQKRNQESRRATPKTAEAAEAQGQMEEEATTLISGSVQWR